MENHEQISMPDRLTRVFRLCIALIFWVTAGEAGAQWVGQFSGTNVRLTDVKMVDSMTAVAVGYGRTIVRTTDAGETWLKVMSNGYNLNAVAFVNGTLGAAVGDYRTVLISTDAGETWTPRVVNIPGVSGNFLSVALLGNEMIMIGNDAGIIIRSTDGGYTWDDTVIASRPIYDLFFTRGTFEITWTGFALTIWNAYKTTNNGNTWTRQTLPLTPQGNALRGDIDGAATAYAVGFDNGEIPFSRIIRRAIADTAWSTYPFGPSSPSVILRDVSAPSTHTAYACGSGGIVFRTLDGGATWTSVPTGTTTRLNAIDFLNDHRGLAVGELGTVIFTASGTTDVPAGPELPYGYRLYNNYPNPFNPGTTIRFCIPRREHVSLKVFDVLGRAVATLVDEEREPGDYTARFDGSAMASGIYICRLVTDRYAASTAMLLLK